MREVFVLKPCFKLFYFPGGAEVRKRGVFVPKQRTSKSLRKTPLTAKNITILLLLTIQSIILMINN